MFVKAICLFMLSIIPLYASHSPSYKKRKFQQEKKPFSVELALPVVSYIGSAAQKSEWPLGTLNLAQKDPISLEPLEALLNERNELSLPLVVAAITQMAKVENEQRESIHIQEAYGYLKSCMPRSTNMFNLLSQNIRDVPFKEPALQDSSVVRLPYFFMLLPGEKKARYIGSLNLNDAKKNQELIELLKIFAPLEYLPKSNFVKKSSLLCAVNYLENFFQNNFLNHVFKGDVDAFNHVFCVLRSQYGRDIKEVSQSSKHQKLQEILEMVSLYAAIAPESKAKIKQLINAFEKRKNSALLSKAEKEAWNGYVPETLALLCAKCGDYQKAQILVQQSCFSGKFLQAKIKWLKGDASFQEVKFNNVKDTYISLFKELNDYKKISSEVDSFNFNKYLRELRDSSVHHKILFEKIPLQKVAKDLPEIQRKQHLHTIHSYLYVLLMYHFYVYKTEKKSDVAQECFKDIRSVVEKLFKNGLALNVAADIWYDVAQVAKLHAA